jgi:hypothetical protein
MSEEETPEKVTCRRCNKEQELDQYQKNRHGYTAVCRTCRAESRATKDEKDEKEHDKNGTTAVPVVLDKAIILRIVADACHKAAEEIEKAREPKKRRGRPKKAAPNTPNA